MNKVLKKVLIYLGVGALGAMVGIGALVGVSSCAYKQDNNTQEKVKAQPKRKKITFSESDLNNNNKYYFVAKNYDDNGAGAFWRRLGQGQLISTADYDNGIEFNGLTTNEMFTNGITMLREGSNRNYDRLYFGLTHYEAYNRDILTSVNFYTSDYSSSTSLFYLSDNQGDSTFNRVNSSFVASNLSINYQVNGLISIINRLFNIYILSNDTFTFAEQINYYAPYAQDINSNYVADSSMISTSSYSLKTIISDMPFYTGGYVFDTIRLRYMTALAGIYMNDSGVRYVMSENGSATYMWTEYVNSVTEYVLITNERLYNPYYSNNETGYVTLKGSKWNTSAFQKLQFFDNLSDLQITALSKLNNSSYSNGFSIVNNNDIGIGSVFSLLSQAFTAWTPIFAIQIVPGITIGLLLFLPLIAGVIVLIIWVVKR